MLQNRADIKKYAFIVMCPGLDPADYRIDFTGRDLTTFVGVSSIDQAESLVRQLASEGYDAYNLCGAFDEAMSQRLAKAAGPGVPFSYVTFAGDEIRKRGNADIMQSIWAAPAEHKPHRREPRNRREHQHNRTELLLVHLAISFFEGLR